MLYKLLFLYFTYIRKKKKLTLTISNSWDNNGFILNVKMVYKHGGLQCTIGLERNSWKSNCRYLLKQCNKHCSVWQVIFKNNTVKTGLSCDYLPHNGKKLCKVCWINNRIRN